MIFQTLAGEPCGEVSLNQLSVENYDVICSRSPMLDPGVCQQKLDDYHKSKGHAWSFGGFLEDRSNVWRGSYLDKTRSYIHLGTDFNARTGTPVFADRAGAVLYADEDVYSIGGWGGRMFARLDDEDVVLLYAHIDRACEVGDKLQAGQRIGNVQPPTRNGRWYAHAHVQVLTLARFERFLEYPEGLDGYGRAEDLPRLKEEFLDPMDYVRVQ